MLFRSIPASAFYEEMGSGYVYVIEEVEGILGTEYRTRKVSVSVLERNGSDVAISSAALGVDSEIIERSNKEFEENAAVRVMKD